MAVRGDTGLGEDDVVRLRKDVAEGRGPRVGVSGVQFPAGTIGTVVRVGKPPTDGPDYIVVRVKMGRVTDELGFSPKELSLARKGRTAPPAPAPARTAAPAPAPARTAAPVSTTNRQEKPQRRAPVPAVTLTIASAGAAWAVTAQRGAKVVVKKASVPPGVVAAIAALLGQPGVDDAVAAVNDTARGEAEARAEKLRAELAEVEAVLTSHRRP
jgi:hypothetical protein